MHHDLEWIAVAVPAQMAYRDFGEQAARSPEFRQRLTQVSAATFIILEEARKYHRYMLPFGVWLVFDRVIGPLWP